MTTLTDNKEQLIQILTTLNEQRLEVLAHADAVKIEQLTNPTNDESQMQRMGAMVREYDNAIKSITKVIQIYSRIV